MTLEAEASWRARAAPIAVVALAFAAGLAQSWKKWGSLLVDVGRELELPRRMLAGSELYSDLRYYYGPLAPHLNAALYRAFGVSSDVLAAAGICTAAAMTAVVFLLARRFVDRWLAAAASVAFVAVCAFPHLYPNPIFNFVLPYSFAATYGMLAAATSLLFLVRFAQLGRPKDLWWSAGALAITALTKAELLVALGAAHGAFLLAQALARTLKTGLFAPYGAAVGVVGALYGVLAARVGPALWSDNLAVAVNPALRPFVNHVLGLDDPWGALWRGAASVAVLAAAGALAARVTPLIGVIAIGLAYAAMPGWLPLRFVPLLAAALVAWHGWRWWRAPGERGQRLPALMLWVFCVGCVARIAFAASPYGYGFYLLPVPLVGLATLGLGPWRRAVAIGLLVGTAALCARESAVLYAQHTVALDTPRGSLMLNGDGFEARVVAYLAQKPATTRVLALPVGAGVVFFSGLDDAGDGMTSYFPVEVMGTRDDAGLLARWSAKPPDVVVYFRWSMREYGHREFGADFAQQSFAYVKSQYRPVAGLTGMGLVLERANDAAPGR